MSIFQCERCGCAENTASGVAMFHYVPEHFDWSYAPDLEGKKLCSACGPRVRDDGVTPTMTAGKWHGVFRRVYLPMGMFKTDPEGNLAHIETLETDLQKYELKRDEFPSTRPLPARHVYAWGEANDWLGVAMSVERDSGVAIMLLNGTVFDSNYIVYWSYADEQN